MIGSLAIADKAIAEPFRRPGIVPHDLRLAESQADGVMLVASSESTGEVGAREAASVGADIRSLSPHRASDQPS